MAETVSIDAIRQLSVAERIHLVEEIWESIASEPEAVPLTDAQIRELDARIARHNENPLDVISWEQIKGELGRE